MRVQAQGEQLHQAHLVIACTVIYPRICASDSILLLWPVTTTTYCVPVYRDALLCSSVYRHGTDALLCSSVYRHRIDALQDSMSGWWMRTMKQNSGSHEHLSQYRVLICMHYCRSCILNVCGCCMCYTRYYCHTQTLKWTNTSPLPYSPPCTNPDSDTAITVALFALSHKNMARSRIPEMNWASENHEEALQLFKQTMSNTVKVRTSLMRTPT